MASSSKQKPEESPENGRPIVIKKYPNRRLYNTATSSYIVQADIVDLVKSGVDFVVQDAKTGEDLTRTILNQIIFEQEARPDAYHFPLEFQKQLISMYGDNYGHMIPDYLTQSMNLFAAERSKIREAYGDMIGRNTNAFMEFSAAMAKQNLELFRRSISMFTLPGAKDKTSSGSDPEADASEQASIAEMQKQIDELQNKLKKLK